MIHPNKIECMTQALMAMAGPDVHCEFYNQLRLSVCVKHKVKCHEGGSGAAVGQHM